jgi:hypothetical protein
VLPSTHPNVLLLLLLQSRRAVHGGQLLVWLTQATTTAVARRTLLGIITTPHTFGLEKRQREKILELYLLLCCEWLDLIVHL